MADKFVNWQAPDRDNEVSYSVAVMESMRREAVVGLQKIPKRGLEIGGVLFGTHEGNRVVIHQWREIDCEHAGGPGFDLSKSDEARLQQFLADAANDSTLGQFEPVGWFRSRTRGSVFLSDSDLALFDRFFPEPWQVSLVIRPYTYEPALAGFFIREASGGVQRESSLNPFELDQKRKRISLGFDPSQAPRRPVEMESNAWSSHAAPRTAVPPLPPDAPASRTAVPPLPSDASASRTAVPPPPPDPSAPPPPNETPAGVAGGETPDSEQKQPRPARPRSIPIGYGDNPQTSKPRSTLNLALIGLAGFLVILTAVVLGVPALSEPSSRGIGLQVRDTGGLLILEWDNHAAGIRKATGATLTITDSREVREIQLTPDELRGGTLVYERQTGSVEVGLTLHTTGAAPVSEFTRFVGTDPVRVPDAPMREELNRAMIEERTRLQQRFEAEASQIEELQKAVGEERARLGR